MTVLTTAIKLECSVCETTAYYDNREAVKLSHWSSAKAWLNPLAATEGPAGDRGIPYVLCPKHRLTTVLGKIWELEEGKV